MAKVGLSTAVDTLNKLQSKYDSKVDDVAMFLEKYILFDFKLVHQPSDGWTVLNVDTAGVAGLDEVIEIILKNGVLTEPSFELNLI